MSVQIKLRRDTAANWVSVNPVLGAGEPGLETDTLKIKYGDGVSHWNSLTYPTVYSTPTPASALTGTTLPNNILNSSLQSVGVLTNLTVTNPIVGSITGNAATATTATSATSAINSTNSINANIAATLSGGAANELVYQTGSGNIAYVTAPAIANTFLQWNGSSFSWSAAPTTTANSLSGTTLASNVVSSSLTSVGTLTNLTVANPISGSVTGSAGSVAASAITGTTLAGTVVSSSLTSVGILSNLLVGAAASYSDTGIIATFANDTAGYNQIILQNKDSGTTASTNFNVSNNLATATTNYGEFGMNSSNFSGTATAFSQPGYVYLAAATTDLAIGTYGSNNIHFVVNSGTTDAMTISSAGNTTVNGNITLNALEFRAVNYITVSSSATYSLSTTTSTNILLVTAGSLTATINMPTTPANGQIVSFSVATNTVTLAVGTGTVSPSFAGSTTAGTVYKYVYNSTATTWYKV